MKVHRSGPGIAARKRRQNESRRIIRLREEVVLSRTLLERGERELIEAVERSAIAVSRAATLTQLAS